MSRATDDLVAVHGAVAVPHEHRDRARRLAVQQQLRLRGDERVGDVGAGERHARDRRADVQHGRAADDERDRRRRPASPATPLAPAAGCRDRADLRVDASTVCRIAMTRIHAMAQIGRITRRAVS